MLQSCSHFGSRRLALSAQTPQPSAPGTLLKKMKTIYDFEHLLISKNVGQTTKVFSRCEKVLGVNLFLDREWRSGDADRKCKGCTHEYGQTTKPCSKCKKELAVDCFVEFEWKCTDANRRCKGCTRGYKLQRKACSACSRVLPRSAYGKDHEWYADDGKRKCMTCGGAQSKHGIWKCWLLRNEAEN